MNSPSPTVRHTSESRLADLSASSTSKSWKILVLFVNLSRIAFSYNPNEHYKKSFIFTLKCDEYYEMNDPLDDPFLSLLNPERILYCICFIKKDYLETVRISRP